MGKLPDSALSCCGVSQLGFNFDNWKLNKLNSDSREACSICCKPEYLTGTDSLTASSGTFHPEPQQCSHKVLAKY